MHVYSHIPEFMKESLGTVDSPKVDTTVPFTLTVTPAVVITIITSQRRKKES